MGRKSKSAAHPLFRSRSWVYALHHEPQKESNQKARWLAPGQALQNSWQTDSSELLARWSSQYRLHGMLSHAGSAASEQTALSTPRAADSAQPVVVWLSHQGVRVVFQSTPAGPTALQPTWPADFAQQLAQWTPLHRLQHVPQQPSGISRRQGTLQQTPAAPDCSKKKNGRRQS